jgi:hypothetical protein
MSSTTCQINEEPAFGWWLEIGIQNPICLAYLGSFSDEDEANRAKHERLEELHKQDLKVVFARSKFCHPRKLKIYENELTIQDLESTPVQFFEALVLH